MAFFPFSKFQGMRSLVALALHLTLGVSMFGCGPFDIDDFSDWIPEPHPDHPGPYTPHLCIGFGNEAASDEKLAVLCEDFPYEWASECNVELQTCTDFVTSVRSTCGDAVTTCDYEKCSKALEKASCGDWPQECEILAKCESAPGENVPTTGGV